MDKQLYHYKAKVVSVYDGDTCTIDIDLGLHTWIRGEKIRLNRINAPELKGKDRAKGIASRDFLKRLILDKEIIIETTKDAKEKYGRYLGEIWLKDSSGNFINVNDEMVKNKFAKYQKY